MPVDMETSAEDVRRAFKGVGDVDVTNEGFVKFCTDLMRQNAVSASDLVTKWEVLALNHPNFSSDKLMKKLGESIAKDRQRDDAKRRKVYGKKPPRQEFDAQGGRVQAAGYSSPVMTKRTVSKMAGQSRRIDDFSQKFGLDLGEGVSSPSQKRSAGNSNMAGSRSMLLSGQKKRVKLEAPQTPTKADSGQMKLPTSSSPICSTAGYAERTDMGKVELCEDMGNTGLSWETVCAENQERTIASAAPKVELVSELREPYQYMYTTIPERANVLEDQIVEMKEYFKEAHGWNDEDFAPVSHTGQDEVLVVGRICCEAPNGKLNANSLLLEGSRTEANGVRVKLELDAKIPSFSFFPGQIVALRGVCPSGHTFHVREVYTSAKPPLVTVPLSRASRQEAGQTKPLSMMTAAGPFSTLDDLEYEPLEDLLANVVEAKPDVLILMGPFVDAKHPHVASGKCKKTLESGETLHLTFKDVMEFVLQRIASVLDECPTRVVIVPALDDITHDVAYPQPPLPRALLADVELADPGQIIFAPNPCVLQVNQYTVAVNTQDTILHLAQEDVAKVDKTAPKRKRIQRLAEHMLQQRSFYPMFPPGQGAELELTQRHNISLNVQPDFLLVTSKLMHFAHDLEGTLCVNPGKLTRGRTGGMYARVLVKPRTAEELQATVTKRDGEEDPLVPNNVSSRTRVEIVRI